MVFIMSELRIGLVGTGGIGRTHIERINTKLQGGKVVACADPAGAFGLSVAEKYGIKGFENPIDMINSPEIDAVMCTTADPYHEQYVLASTLLKLRNAVDPMIGINLDPSHMMIFGADPIAAARALKGCIYHVHGKDARIERGLSELVR